MHQDSGKRPVSARLLAWTLAGALLCAGLLALGNWQVQRRAWKLDLIARVEARVHAAPIEAPRRAAWMAVNAENDAYRHVTLHGVFLHDRETLVQAATVLGAGFWVLTPLRRDDDSCILVNRGFVPPEQRDPATRADNTPAGAQTVSGLLRISEPGGGFLRSNDAAARRWYSRDVTAITTALGLANCAPYFVDADAKAGVASGAEHGPVGGLTVVTFHNSHLVYAITWYTLALMVAATVINLWCSERRHLPAHGIHNDADGD